MIGFGSHMRGFFANCMPNNPAIGRCYCIHGFHVDEISAYTYFAYTSLHCQRSTATLSDIMLAQTHVYHLAYSKIQPVGMIIAKLSMHWQIAARTIA